MNDDDDDDDDDDDSNIHAMVHTNVLPRFSLSGVQPSCGPLSGGTDVAVSGEGLVGSSAAAARFVVEATGGVEGGEGGEGGQEGWTGDAMPCTYDASAGCLRFVTSACDPSKKAPLPALLHVTLDGVTWKPTSLLFNLYAPMEFTEPKPKAFVVGTKGGPIFIAPADGVCVASGHVTVRFVCGETQLEEVGSSDVAGVTVQAPDFVEAGDYTVSIALNGKQVRRSLMQTKHTHLLLLLLLLSSSPPPQFAPSCPVINVTAGKKK